MNTSSLGNRGVRYRIYWGYSFIVVYIVDGVIVGAYKHKKKVGVTMEPESTPSFKSGEDINPL